MIRDEDLAALWSAPPPPAEERELARLARRTPRLARLALWGDIVAGALLAGIILFSMTMNLGPATLVTGGIVLLLLAWSVWKRNRLRNIGLLIDERDRLLFIRSLVRAKEADLDRSALGLALILPGTLITLLLAFALRVPGGDGGLATFLAAVLTSPRGLLALGFLLCALVIFCLSHIRLAGELERLRRLQGEYEEAVRSDQFAHF